MGTLPTFLSLVDSSTQSLLQSLSMGINVDNQSDPASNHVAPLPHSSPIPGISGWGLFEAHGDTELDLSAEEQGIALIAKSLLDRFDELSMGSEDNEAE